MGGRVIDIPEIARREIPIDIKTNYAQLPNGNCALIAADQVTDDRVIVETLKDGGKKALRFQFKSEVGGPFGLEDPLREWRRQFPPLFETGPKLQYYAPYAIYLTEEGEVYLRPTPARAEGTTQADDANERHAPDDLDRLLVLLTGALVCGTNVKGADGHRQWVLKQYGEQLYYDLHRTRHVIRAVGADLAERDRIENMKRHNALMERLTKDKTEAQEECARLANCHSAAGFGD